MISLARAAGLAAACGTFAAPSVAFAQVHWDVGAEVGAMQRVTTARGAHAPGPTLGPMAELHAHVALFPMLRVGPYVTYDLSPVAGEPARQMLETGLRGKFAPPLLPTPWRIWAFAGVGYVGATQPSHPLSQGDLAQAPTASGSKVGARGGGFLDLPFGVGTGMKVRGPWVIFAELSGRVGLIFSGSLYDTPQCACSDQVLGKDSLSVALSVGVSLEQ